MTDETNIPNNDVSFSEAFAKYLEQDAKDRLDAKKKLQKILVFLREHNVVSFGMTYKGTGDSGCVGTTSLFNRTFSDEELYEVEYAEADGDKEIEIQKALVNQTSQDFLDNLADTLMDLLVPVGYEIDGGGQGVIVLNVASGEVIGEHGSNYVQVDTTSIDLDTETSDEV